MVLAQQLTAKTKLNSIKTERKTRSSTNSKQRYKKIARTNQGYKFGQLKTKKRKDRKALQTATRGTPIHKQDY